MREKRIGNFRSSIFGGFNRRDVIGYIEQLHKKLSDLQDENELLHSKLPPEEPVDKDDIESQNDHLEPGLEESELKMEPDDSGFSLESEPDERPAEPVEPVLPDASVSNYNESSGQSVSVTKKIAKVRKKTKR